MRNYTKTLVLLFNDSVVARFQHQNTEPKNPATQANMFLRAILNDPEHELYEALLNGEITEVSGTERGRRPVQKTTV